MEISIVTSNYNRAHFLKDSLYLMGQQTMNQKDYEVIIVDDGSTDDTDETVEEAREWMQNLHYIKKTVKRSQYGNCAEARNVGSKYAKGEILLETDPEVMPMADWIFNHWKAHQIGNKTPRHNQSAITIEPDKYYSMVGLCLQFWHYDIITEQCRGYFLGALEDWDFRDIEYVWKELNRIIGNVEKKYGIPLLYPNLNHFYIFQQTQAGMSFRKDLFLKMGGYDEIFCSPELDLWAGEDTDWNYRMDRNTVVRIQNQSIRAIHLWHTKRTEGYRSVEFAHQLNRNNPGRKVANEGRSWGELGDRWTVMF